VLYGESHRFAIWARVRIKVPCSQVVAAESLMPGRPLEALQLRVATGQCFPNLSGGKISPDSLVGLLPLHPIAAGSPVRPELLTRPNDINRGDLVEVEVRSRAVHLVFSGRADSAGRGGDTIAVRNLVTNRIFAAQVISKGKAIVFPDANKTIE
jgi:flagella basal body P-ring formation protein FlgA